MSEHGNYWAARHDALRPTDQHDFDDAAHMVAATYELYSRAANFLGPWNAKQIGSNFPYRAPEREQLKAAIGKPRPCIADRTYAGLVDSIIAFCNQSKGRRQLVTPSPTTHHSAQFPSGTFTLTTKLDTISLYYPSGVRPSRPLRALAEIKLVGATAPIYVENPATRLDDVRYLIVRPRLGKLGTPNLSRWEVLFFKSAHSYLIEHTDSQINPRWSGIL
jgi:hypothetical protein